MLEIIKYPVGEYAVY